MSVLTTIIASVVIFGLIIFLHELGHFLAARISGVAVNEFALGMGPTIFRFKSKNGETWYSLRALPIGGFCAMEGEDEDSESEHSFGKAPLLNRVIIIVAGAFMNLVLGFTVLCILVCSDSAITSKTVSNFYDGAVTQESGLEVGDTFYSINGRRLYVANDIIYEMMRVDDGVADVVVIRDGEQVELNDFRFGTVTAEDGTTSIQIDFTVYPIAKTFGTVLGEALRETLSTMRLIYVSIFDLITGNVAFNQLSGPVGIVSAIGTAASYGIKSIANLMAFISINLGIVNLLPFPALDGGRLVLLLVEGVTRKKLPQKYEGLINIAGLALLMLLMVAVTYNDITKLFG